MAPGYFTGTRSMTLLLNHESGLRVARLLTAVGLRRASIGPPIMTMVRGLTGASVVGHQRNRGQHRHRRLAHRDHVHVGSEEGDELAHVVDVIVEMKRAVEQRHHARVHPVGDVDVVIGQQRAHRIAQQRGVVARTAAPPAGLWDRSALCVKPGAHRGRARSAAIGRKVCRRRRSRSLRRLCRRRGSR